MLYVVLETSWNTTLISLGHAKRRPWYQRVTSTDCNIENTSTSTSDPIKVRVSVISSTIAVFKPISLGKHGAMVDNQMSVAGCPNLPSTKVWVNSSSSSSREISLGVWLNTLKRLGSKAGLGLDQLQKKTWAGANDRETCKAWSLCPGQSPLVPPPSRIFCPGQ